MDLSEVIKNEKKLSDLMQELEVAFKECVKCKSKVIKDEYDKSFLEELIKKYKEKLRSNNSNLSKDELNSFLINIMAYGKNLVENEKKLSTQRKKAVNHFINVSTQIIDILDNKASTNLRSVKGTPFVLDIEYLTIPYFSEKIPLSVRCYIVVSGDKLTGHFLNETFDFINYEMTDNNGNNVKICDEDMKNGKRNLYSVVSTQFEVFLVGKIKIDVYMSPNNWLNKFLVKHFTKGLKLLEGQIN